MAKTKCLTLKKFLMAKSFIHRSDRLLDILSEKFKVSEEEIKEEMKAIAKTHNVPLARVVESINQEGQKEELKDNLLIRKTVDFLVKSAIIE